MSEWKHIDDAPRDGTWIVLEGEFAGGDTSSVRIGRWNPEGMYEWQFFDCEFTLLDLTVSLKDVIENRYCEGRIYGWIPLPGLSDD